MRYPSTTALLSACVVAAALLPSALAQLVADADGQDTRRYKTPGYIFIDPVHGARNPGVDGEQAGPEIREQDGTLVWYGGVTETVSNEEVKRLRVQDFGPCDFRGEKGNHLCMSEQVRGQRRKHVVMDTSYEFAAVMHAPLNSTAPNMHEFNMVFWPVRNMSLVEYGGPINGSIMDACIQDVSLLLHEPVFTWCWMENLPVWETLLFPSGGPNVTNITSTKVGSGSIGNPWDAWHLNSADKNAEGDYLISVRHNDQILMIAGNNNTSGRNPGDIIWRFGGRGNTITVEGEPFKFAKQHGVRFISTTETETTFSILDNAWEGLLEPTSPASSGMIISVNNATMTARLLRKFVSPTEDLAPSQGNFQTLPNKNIFISWGSRAKFTEYSPDGEVLYHASYTNKTDPNEEDLLTYSYRVYKGEWEGYPVIRPKLVAFSRDCNLRADSPLMAWVSWNGATQVRAWRFYASNGVYGPWYPIGTWKRKSFETEVVLSDSKLLDRFNRVIYPSHISVEALDEAGEPMEHGWQHARTFVPSSEIRHTCSPYSCPEEFDYTNVTFSIAGTCNSKTLLLPNLIIFLFVVVIIEIVSHYYLRMYSAIFERGRWRYGALGSSREIFNQESTSMSWRRGHNVSSSVQSVDMRESIDSTYRMRTSFQNATT